MSAEVRTTKDLVWRVGSVTLVSVVFSLLVTYVAGLLFLGADLHRSVSGPEMMKIWLALAALVPAIVAPVFSYRTTRLSREAIRARDALDLLANVDQLTGLLNRRGFDPAASSLLREAVASAAPVAALMIDIDVFKAVNDDLGHDFGDAALLHVSNELRSATAAHRAVLGRQGGDEFAVVLFGVPLVEVTALAENMRAACAARPVVCSGRSAKLTISIGISGALAGKGGALKPLLSAADAALLAAKRQGRDCVVVSVAALAEMAKAA